MASTRYNPSPARPLVDQTTEYGTGLRSVTAGIEDAPATLVERVLADPSNLRSALGLPTATTAEMEAGTESNLRAMSPALVNSAIAALSPAYIHRSASDGAVNYIGKALAGSSTSAAAWTITRITVASSGTVSTATASNVAWDDYLTATYS